MVPRCVVILVALIGFGLTSLRAAEQKPVIGNQISGLKFKDIRGLQRTLTDFGERKAFVLIFTTTHCPLVRRSMPKLIELDERFGPQGIQFVAVNVGSDDSIRDMAAQAIEFEAAFPFVKDLGHHCVRSIGVQRTPEVAVLNAQHRLVYRGRIDDQLRLGGALPEPQHRELEDALTALLADRPISVAETPVDGCVISESEPVSNDGPVPEFHRDVAVILHRRCVSCHRPGTAAPFPLLSYAEVVAQAAMIEEVVLDLRMPPWYAHREHGRFQNDPSLTDVEKRTLVRWVRGGCKEGSLTDAPPTPMIDDSEWRIGKPDVVITMLEEHQIPATGFVPYRYAVLPHVFLGETWLEAIEIKPDNPAVVHHCNMAYVVTKGAGEETLITGYVPGGQPMDLGRFNNNVAFRIPPFAGLGLQIHYTTTGKPERCRISVGLRFPRRTVKKSLHHILLDPHNIRIPPEHGAFAIRSERALDHDITLLGLFTHMHVRGKDMTFFAHAPDQPRETLLRIPNYNFEWQLGYEIEPGAKRLPKGTRIEAVAHYDNSKFNPFNPDASRTVPYGPQTFDEMFNGYVFFVHDDEELNLHIDPKTGFAKPGAVTDPERRSEERKN